MNPNNFSSKVENGKSKTLSSTVLGVPRSHGVKLSLMTSEDKKQFMLHLEEWRKAKKEKLAAKILAKQKLVEKSKLPFNFTLSKTKAVTPSGSTSKFQDKESVFERLYKGNGKFKKSEMNNISNKITEDRNTKKSTSMNASKSLKVSKTDALSEKSSKASASKLVAGESLNNMISLSAGTEVSVKVAGSESTRQKFFEQSLTAAVPNLKIMSQFPECKYSEVKPVSNKYTLAKKLEINRPSTFTEAPFKNLSPRIGAKISTEKLKIPLRRSISMTFRQKNRAVSIIRKSISAKNIHELQVNMGVSVDDKKLNPKNKATGKSISLITPKTKQFSLPHLRANLEDWLKMNGHSLEGYRHLRCFGIEKNATPFRPDSPLVNSLFYFTPGTPSHESDKENVTPSTTVSQVDVTQVENWLKELHELISKMKYPSDKCEEWLAAIRKKYPKCSQLPVYWECLAALNKSKDDVKSTIEGYEKESIKGGQVQTVGNTLEQLFDKMVIEQKKPTKSKIEKGIDPKNIFKSTIIKFALQEKSIRKLGPQLAPSPGEQLYIATPVRRSSRIQTPLTSKEVATLDTLTPDVKKNLTFKPNESLMEAD